MRIKNIKIYTPEQTFVPGEMRITGEWISEIAYEDTLEPVIGEECIDGEGAYAMPGFLDMHFHGCMGADFCDGTEEAVRTIAQYEESIGVTAIAPATMTLSDEELVAILENAAAYRKKQHFGGEDLGADLIGINMEGPFISPVKKGAQDGKWIKPCEVASYRKYQQAADGLVKVIGLAPEEAPFVDYVKTVSKEVVVSLAHTNAPYETAAAAICAGASHAVHLYNAMPPFHHRDPGVVGAVAEANDVTAELICDGIHVHPAMVRATFQMLGAERMILISDSMRATGLADGTYTLGGQEVSVHGKEARLVSDGALAGSVTSLPDCVRTIVKQMGIPLETAVACATMHPAKRLGMSDTYGVLAEGRRADVVLWNPDLELQMVLHRGKKVKTN